MSSALDKLKAPVQQELKLFEDHFRQSLRSNIPLLDRITHYIVKSRGKQLRPMFVFLCAKLNGEVSGGSYNAATMIELLHTATLVHDDVVDDSHMRRGFFSVNALWKNKIAVLVGDYLLSRGLLLAVEQDEFNLLKIMSRAVKEMSEGELLQIEKARKLDIQEPIYFDIIRQKTASLIAAACAAGRASVTEDKEEIERMRLFGENVGMAFQIKDDLFDFGESNIGKPKGIDIKEKKMTLPLIYSINHADKKTKRWIINTVKRFNTDKKKVNELIAYVRANGGIEYATSVMEGYRDKALKILYEFDDTPARTSLDHLVHYIISRKN